MTQFRRTLLAGLAMLLSTVTIGTGAMAEESRKTLAYLVSDRSIPFWDIMWRGIEQKSQSLGYDAVVFSADNEAKKELQNTVQAIQDKVAGIVVSPTNSSACVTVLLLAAKANIPVVIADIGADSGEFVTYISSDNRDGAYKVGQILADRLQRMEWQDGTVGIIAIPQKRANGKARTSGFMQALDEAGIKAAGLKQQVDFSAQETYDHATSLIRSNPDLRALWLQGSDKYQAALNAIADSGRAGDILLITFDAEPEFLDLIPEGKLVGAGMQQPYLMGEMAVEAMHKHLQGGRVDRMQKLPVLAISQDNIAQELPAIRRNVLGIQ